MAAYYNENNKYCARWLGNLIREGLICNGVVDDRPIQEVKPEDLTPYIQCHFFAGIGGWSYALRLADWPDNLPVWTGSCPCQPFSIAGSKKGFADERHLWPTFKNLIKKSQPPTVFGEQVAAATNWLSRVRSDLEAMDYAVGAIPIEAACCGLPQYRDRFWFVANHDGMRTAQSQGMLCNVRQWPLDRSKVGSGVVADRSESRWNGMGQHVGGSPSPATRLTECSELRIMANILRPRLERVQSKSEDHESQLPPMQRSGFLGLEHPPLYGWGKGWTESEFRSRGFTAAVASSPGGSIQFIQCPDGKFRRLPPPRVRWLGNGIPSRVAKLCAFGNAIVPQVAATFIKAAM